MKENKKIDNKMKAKKLAAYTLATCMTVTVAPIGAVTPIAAEVESVEMHAALATAKSMTVSIETNIAAGMTYEDAINKIIMTDLTKDESVGTLVSDSIAIYDEDGNLLYAMNMTSETDTDTRKTDKFEVGKKYTIAAEFDATGITTTGTTKVVVEGNVANVAPSSLNMSAYELDLTTSSSALKLDDYPDASSRYAYRNEKGEIQKNVTTIAKNKDGWFYVKDGYKTAPGKVIVASNAYGTWLVAADGEVKFNATGLAKDSEGNILYVKDSKVDTSKTDIITVNANSLTGDIPDGKYNIVNGKLAKGVTVAHEKDTGKWLYIDKDGKVDAGKNGFATNANGTWVIVAGEVDFTAKGAKADTNKDVSDAGSTYFVKGGKIDTTKNETIVTAPATSTSQVVQVIKDGVVQAKVNLPSATVLQGSGDDAKNWYAVDKKGKTVYAAGGGLASNQYGTWYIENGKVDFNAKGLIVDTGSVVSNDNTKIYYIEGGKIKTDKTGFVEAVNTPAFTGAVSDGKKYYVENGVVKLPEKDNSIFHNKDDGEWYLLDANGAIDTGSTRDGIAKNVNGVWRVDDGIVNFNYTGVQQDTDKLIGTDNQKKYYFEKGKLTLTKTGVVEDSVSGAISYVEKGVVTGRDVTDSVVQKDKDWYSIKDDGTPDTSARIGANKYGVWELDGSTGAVAFGAAEKKITVNTAAEVKATGLKTGTSMYFKDGKFQSNFSGLVNVGSGYEYVENGVFGTTDKTDILQASDGNWYYVEDGLVSGATGIFENANGKWYVDGGKVDFNKTGIVTVSFGATAGTYYVEKGKVSETVTGVITVGKTKYYVVKNKVTPITDINKNVVQDVKTGKWYCIDGNGEVDTTKQFGKNDNGIWVLADDGSVDFSKSGVVTVKASIYGLTTNQMITVKNGKYTPAETITGIYTGADGNEYYYENGSVALSKTGTYNGKYIKAGKVDNSTEALPITDQITYVGKKVIINSGIISTKSGINGNDYFKNGVQDTSVTGIVDDEFNASPRKVYVVNGEFQSSKTDVVSVGTDKWNLVGGVVTRGVPGTQDVYADTNGTKYYIGANGIADMAYNGFGYDGSLYYKFAAGVVDTNYSSSGDFTYNNGTISGKTFAAGVSD